MLSSLKHTLRSSSNPAGGIADAPVAKLKISQRVTGTKPSKGKVGGGGGGGEKKRESETVGLCNCTYCCCFFYFS